MDPHRAVALSSQLRLKTTPIDCAPLFRSVIEPFGFDAFACGVVDLKDRARSVFYIIDWPDRWREFYVTSGLINIDPVISALSFRTDPFTWVDLRADRKLAEAGREALDRAAAEGWKDGLVIPIRYSQDRVGIVSLSGPAPVVTPDTREYLCLLAMLLQGHVRNLVAQAGFAVPPVGMSKREIEAVALVAQGLPDAAIAKTLNVAPSTAHEFVEKAKRRLHAHSRSQLVGLAVELGIISA